MNAKTRLHAYKSGKAQGFTLVEVLVALAIFTVVAVSASTAAMSFTSATERMRTKTLAHFVAKNAAVDMRLQQKWLKGVATQRVSEQGATWQIDSKSETTGRKDVRRITLTVSTVEEGKKANQVHELVVLMEKPKAVTH